MIIDLAEDRRALSDQNKIALRSPSMSLARSTMEPWTSFSMISLNPLERVVITGSPEASASKHALENGS
jgi:hypothetical protein